MAKLGQRMLLVLFLPLLAHGLPFGKKEAKADELAEGRKIVGRNCARCHAIGKAGDSPHPSAPPFRNVAAKGHVDDLQEAFAEGIMVGHPDMPEFALEPAQITAVLGYLKSLAPPVH